MDEFPGNSFVSKKIMVEEKAEIEEPPKFEKVIKGKVTRRKKTLLSRFKDAFVIDGSSFVDYLVEEVVVPMFKDMLVTALKQSTSGFGEAIEQKIYGEVRSRKGPRRTGGPVPYNQYSSRSSEPSRREYARPKVRQSNRVDDVLFESRGEGDDLIARLEGAIERDGFCTVADLYDALGEKPSSVDTQWGWSDLSLAKVVLTRDGFLLRFPTPEHLG